VFTVKESDNISFDPSEEGQVFNFDDPNVTNADEYVERLIFYDWLADSA